MSFLSFLVSFIFVCFSLIPSIFSYPSSDLVSSLPGYSSPLPSLIFSGHIDAGKSVDEGKEYSVKMWYMLVLKENTTLENAWKEPLLLWSNGGPGASSAYGLFTEFGPLLLSTESLVTSPPTLFYNPYSWTRLASVLILNGPAPVGYSYCDGDEGAGGGPAGNGTSCGTWSDERTAYHNIQFLKGFFSTFNEFIQNNAEFYIAGESYAGVYTGMITSALLSIRDNDPSNILSQVNLQGLAVGDACMGTEVVCGGRRTGPWLGILFSAGQGCISLKTFEAILDECDRNLLRFGPIEKASKPCLNAIAKSQKECPDNAYYGYNYLDQCPSDPFFALKTTRPSLSSDPPPPLRPSGYACGTNHALKTWITDASVKKSLHVVPESNFWSFDNGEGFVYNSTFKSNIPLMERLQTGKDGVRVMVYEGETDPSISSVRAQNWTFALNFPVKNEWGPWVFPTNDQSTVAGQIIEWEGDIILVTVRGSGHMVPQYKPYSAYLLMENWLFGKEWPRLKPDQQQKMKRKLHKFEL